MDDIFDAEREPEAAALHALAGYEWAWAMRRKDREEFRYVYVTIVMQAQEPSRLDRAHNGLLQASPGIRIVDRRSYDFDRKAVYSLIVDQGRLGCGVVQALTWVLGQAPVPGIEE